jgi:outer membrane protein assembly factor BamB
VTSVSSGTYTQFAASSDGSLYAFTVDGSVDVIRMAFTENDEPKWSEAERTTGQWPAFLRVFTAGDGVFYTIAADGMLLHSRNELNAWTAQSVVGNGWAGFRDAFSPAPGVIYAIQPNGDLLWYRFRGHASGELAQGWEGPMKVGNGWQNFASVIGLPEIQ